MGLRENLQRLADKKAVEIRDLEVRLAQAQAYLQAIQDSMRAVPREIDEAAPETTLRSGSMLAKAKEVLQHEGKPLHILEILTALGKPTDKANRVSLSGSLSAYVRRGVIFKKVGPNTFGLIGLENSSAPSNASQGALSDDFGEVQ